MAAEIVTREARGGRGPSVAGRGWSAALLPAVLLALVAVFSTAPWLDRVVWGRTPLGRDRSAERTRRVLSWTLAGLAVVMATLHLGVLSMHTGEPFPLERATGAAAGFLLVCVGVALPLAAPGGRFTSGRVERFRAALGPAYRRAGFALAGLGLVTIGAALVSPGAAAGVAAAGVFLIFVAAGVAALLRTR
jgi:hypothetical protein